MVTKKKLSKELSEIIKEKRNEARRERDKEDGLDITYLVLGGKIEAYDEILTIINSL